MNTSTWRSKGDSFDFNGHQIFFRDSGSALPVLLLIHGFPTASWDWHSIWDALSSHFRLIAPDMLGFGFSDKPSPHRYSIHEQADLHATLLQHLAVEECHTLVHDYGVSVMQELLARHKESQASRPSNTPKILSACFLNGGLFPVTHRPKLVQKLLLSPIGPLVSRLTSEAAFRRSFSDVFGPNSKPTNAELSSFWSLINHNHGSRIFHLLIRYMQDRKTHEARWRDAILHPTVPVRLINGPEDPVSGRHLADYYRQLVKNSDVVSLDGIGHYPQIEAPDAVIEHFLAFNPSTR